MSSTSSVQAAIETMIIPTYVPPGPEELPMYSEFRQHQGSTGYAYPNKVTTRVEREVLTDREYEVVRLENDYIRLIIVPELGGRVLEGYDKTTDYHFLYRHTRIKPVLVGTYGSWISGGLEFNFPHHHRPSTYMPVDFEVETLEDGTAICWLTERAPSAGQFRLQGTVGIALTPDASYFETKVRLTNPTAAECPFMWWENAGVHVNADYQVFFPQDVTYAHHHYDRHHATWPLTQGFYAVEEHVEIADVSVHKNTVKGNSYFAGPSRYDFFGGFDHERMAGIVHVGNHHISPGKKNFQWGLEKLGDSWNAKLTDSDGEHAELMAGSYSDDQPDFSWLAPYETKSFSQYWYPIGPIKAPTFANLEAALHVDRDESILRLGTTKALTAARLRVLDGTRVALDVVVNTTPSTSTEHEVAFGPERYTLELISAEGDQLVRYVEERPERINLPLDNVKGIATPHELATAQQISLAGRHVDQYRDPSWTGDEYYQVALEHDPEFLPALIGMAQHSLDRLFFERALDFLGRAARVQNAWNPNPSDGAVSYLTGRALHGLGRHDEAYDALYKAAWSANVIPGAMALIAAIDGRRCDFSAMLLHATTALQYAADHPLAGPLAAVAEWRTGNAEGALKRLAAILKKEPLAHLARLVRALISGHPMESLFDSRAMNSNPSQTALDLAEELINAGMTGEAVALLRALETTRGASAVALYVLANALELLEDCPGAAGVRQLASSRRDVDIFPYRCMELEALVSAVLANPSDATAQYLLGCIQYDKHHFADAAKSWQKAVAADPTFYASYRNLAVVFYSKLDRREEALPLLKEALELRPKDDILLKEAAFVMAHTGVGEAEQLAFLAENWPSNPSDNLTLDLANAQIGAGKYQAAVETLEKHRFVPAECTETYLTDAYTLANIQLGRLAYGRGDVQAALELFRRAQGEPAGFDAGWWDTQVLFQARYYEALALNELGHITERDTVIRSITNFVTSNYSPYMPPERFYYIAAAMRLSGDELGARIFMSAKIQEWTHEAANDVDRKLVQTALFISYVDNAASAHRAAMLGALGYSRLFFDDTAGARSYFLQSLALDPSALRLRLELELLK